MTLSLLGVNRPAPRRRASLWGACALIGAAVATGCFRPVRDVPIDPAYTWTAYLGSDGRDAFSSESVTEGVPEIEWNVNTGRGLDAPPVPLGPVIVTATTNRMVIALSAESGSIYWEHRKNGPFQVPPLSDGDRLYLATADTRARVYAMRLVDGKEQWEETYPGLSSPMLLADQRLYFASEPGLVTCLRKRDGDRLWQTALGGPTAAAPVLVDGRLFVGTIRDTLYVLEAEGGEIVDRLPVPDRISAAPAARGGTLYVPLMSGHMLALDAETGEERWRAYVGGPLLAAPVVTQDGTAYTLSRSGDVWSVSADGRPTRLAHLESAATEALTVTRNAVLVGLLDGRLVALSRTDGRELWSLDLGDSVQTPPAVQDGAIYVPLRRGRLVKLR